MKKKKKKRITLPAVSSAETKGQTRRSALHPCARSARIGYQFLISYTYVLAARQSQLSIENKLLLYKAILKPIWTCGAQLWGTASNSNIDIIQRFQNKYLRIIVNAPCYVTNDTLHQDLNVSYVRDEIKKLSQRYADRLEEQHISD